MEHSKQPLVGKVAAAEHMHASKQGQTTTHSYRRLCRTKMWVFLAIALLGPLFLTQLILAGSMTDTTASVDRYNKTVTTQLPVISATGSAHIRHVSNETSDTADAPTSLLLAGQISTIESTTNTSTAVAVGTSTSTNRSQHNMQALDQNATSTTPIFNTTQPYPHPHAGARDANGTWGYVADVTKVRRWMLQRYHDQFATAGMDTEQQSPPSLPPLSQYLPMTANDTAAVCDVPPRKGVEGKHGWEVVLKVDVDVDVDAHRSHPALPLIHNNTSTAHDTTATDSTFQNRHSAPRTDGVSKGKLLCGIYTYEKMHYRLPGVIETWGWRCDGFLAASTATATDPDVPGFPATDLPHEGKEEYDNMWQKTRSILSYMYDHYLDDYDYFYLSGDDTHLIVENLRRFLYETEQTHDVATEPLYIGMKMKARKKLFNGGGSGYVLNRVALQRLVRDAFPTCLVHARQSSEDRFVAKCLEAVTIHPLDTVDALGRQRFHGMDSDFIGSFEGQHGYFKAIYQDWGQRYGFKTGIDLVSDKSVSFHLLRDPNKMRRHHAIMYQSCPVGSVLAKAVQEARTERRRQSQSVVSNTSSVIAS